MQEPDFEVIIGTYEEYLLGYKLVIEDEKIAFKQSFATHEHSSSIRTISSCGRYIASGSADDRIVIYDMVSRKEHCMLTNHSSTINSVEFTPQHTHLMSSSMDGTLAITRVGNWQSEKIWQHAHKEGNIISIAIHPSGKLALTIGTDCTLHTWNLVKGRRAYIINLNSKCDDAQSLSFVKWGPCADKFVLGGGKYVEIWSLTQAGKLKAFTYESKVVCACWLSDNLLCVGHENGEITLLNTETDTESKITADTNRIKCLQNLKNYVISASSSGHVKLWNFNEDTLNEVCEINIECRPTCLAVVSGADLKKDIPEDKKVNAVVEQKNQISKESPSASSSGSTTDLVVKKRKVIVEECEEESETKKDDPPLKKKKDKKLHRESSESSSKRKKSSKRSSSKHSSSSTSTS